MKINRRPIYIYHGVGCPGDPRAYATAARIFRYYIVIRIPILNCTYI